MAISKKRTPAFGAKEEKMEGEPAGMKSSPKEERAEMKKGKKWVATADGKMKC